MRAGNGVHREKIHVDELYDVADGQTDVARKTCVPAAKKGGFNLRRG